MNTLVLVLVTLMPSLSQSVDYSIPAVQKCEVNKIPDNQRVLEIPRDELVFRLTEKCATRLPHCLKPCRGQLTQISVRVEEENEFNQSFGVPYDFNEPDASFTSRGVLRIDDHYYSTDEYCVYSYTGRVVVLRVCPTSCGGGDGGVSGGGSGVGFDPFEVCVPKCCSIHKVLNPKLDACEEIASGVSWAPLVYRSASRRVCGEKRANLKLHFSQSTPSCTSFTKYFLKNVDGNTRVRFRLLTNGTVLLRELGDLEWTVLTSGTYCLDGVQMDGVAFYGDPLDQVLLLCRFDEPGLDDFGGNSSGVVGGGSSEMRAAEREHRLTASGIAYVVLLFSGIPFLAVTAGIYLLVLGQQNVHGWTLFSHTLAVLLHYLAQAVTNIVSRIFTSDQNASTICMVVGVLNHLFVLASFFWLSVINYDLFSMFRHLKNTVGRSRGVKRFLVYSLIAWGIPLGVVCVSVVLDLLYGLYGDDGDCEVQVIVPLYGHKSCYMVPDARPYYLYYPVGILMVINLVLAALTFANMYRHDKESRDAHGEFQRNTKHRRKFSVMAKLFVVMGLVWVFELFVWSFIKEHEVLPWYLIFPDVFNLFQAIAIFLLFACQHKILKQVEDTYPRLGVFTGLLKKLSCNKASDKQGSTMTTASGVPVKNRDLKGDK